MYKSKLVGKPLALDVTHLLKKIQETIQSIFRTYPVEAKSLSGPRNTGVGFGAPAFSDAERVKRERKLEAEIWRGRATSFATWRLVR